MKKIIEFAHDIIKEHVNDTDICVDMTIGNGFDTLFLSSICSFVHGFDIQQIALDNTNNLLLNNNRRNYKLYLTSHDNIDLYINQKIKAFIFNLGYLPGANKNITTNSKTTINAIKKSLALLDINGVIVLVIYPGHSQGQIESIDIMAYVRQLNQKQYDVISYGFINQINNPPYVIAIERKC